MKTLLAILSACIPFIGLAQTKPTYKEQYRPQFHFTPALNWTNDPNGLVYHNGEYHLFYQYNPFGNVWGHMSWGHAVSRDLLHWKHLPVAIPEDDKNMIFSGSCVIDKNNTTGFARKAGQIPMVAIYTAHIIPDKSKPDNYKQNQHIAYSLDNGRSWIKYAGNPVLDFNKRDFRDPKVLWHETTKKWIMATVLPEKHIVQLFSSPNLKEWQHLSDFGPAGDTNDIWECPDLLQVPVTGKPGETKWVLINSGQTTMQYFVGSFDGTRFHNENPAGKILRPDYGPDYYAAITFNNLPAGNAPILLGWANNWKYAQSIPTNPWRSAMSLPRELSLRKDGDTWVLLQQPLHSLQQLRSSKVELENIAVTKESVLPVKGQVLEMDITITPAAAGSCGIRIAVGANQSFIIGYNADTKNLFTDRSNSGNTTFHEDFKSWLRTETPVELQNDQLRLHLYFDKSIVEVFVNDGDKVLTTQIFPEEGSGGVVLFSDQKTNFPSVKWWRLKSVWGEK